MDVRLTDVGEAIQEVMESYEVTIDGKTYPGIERALSFHKYNDSSAVQCNEVQCADAFGDGVMWCVVDVWWWCGVVW